MSPRPGRHRSGGDRPLAARTLRRRRLLRAVVPGAAVLLTACGAAAAGDPGAGTGGAQPVPSPVSVVVPGCSRLVPAGAPSLATTAVMPAAAAVPSLGTFVQAVTRASLIDPFDEQQNVTVLAPDDQAFAALPDAARTALLSDVPRLTAVLTHHVLLGRLGAGDLVGQQITLNNDTVTVQPSGHGLTVPGAQTLTGRPAHVVCGGIRTANATVYVIDQVLAPRGTR